MPPRPRYADRCWPCSRNASSRSRMPTPAGRAGSHRGSTWWWRPHWRPGRPMCRFRRSPSRWTWASAPRRRQFAVEGARVARQWASGALRWTARGTPERDGGPFFLRVPRLQYEDLEAHWRVEGHLAVVGHHSPAGGLLDGLLEAVGHHVLEAHAHGADQLLVTTLHERLLDGGE